MAKYVVSVLSFSRRLTWLSFSTDPFRIPCISSCGRIFAVRPIPSLHIFVPPAPMVVLGSLCVRQLLEYIGMMIIDLHLGSSS